MSAGENRASTIGRHNDAFRSKLSLALVDGKRLDGRLVTTRGFDALDAELQEAAFHAVRTFDAFDAENDPHGERDYGTIEFLPVCQIAWKIDCYADSSCMTVSEDPTDPWRTFRTLTVMRVREY